MMMDTMVIRKFGAPEVFEYLQAPVPKLEKGQVLVRVKATSVNPLDVKLRKGFIPDLTPKFPAVLHGDLAGEVVEVAEGVSEFKKGDRVFGCAGGIAGFAGALAQYMPVDYRLLAHLPANISFEVGAASALTGLTAWEAVFDKVNILPEDRVLVLGGTGGVAHMAIQLARLKTPHVYSTASSDTKASYVKKLGAREVFNYKQSGFIENVLKPTEGAQGYDIVIDTIGADSLDTAIKLARNYGQIISCQSSESHNLSLLQAKALNLHLVLILLPMLTGKKREHHQNILANLSHLMEIGALRPLIHEQKFFLKEVGSAHSVLESGANLGKVVLTIS